MAHDRDYFLRREAEARAACAQRDRIEDAEVAGQLALAYAALARRGTVSEPADEPAEA